MNPSLVVISLACLSLSFGPPLPAEKRTASATPSVDTVQAAATDTARRNVSTRGNWKQFRRDRRLTGRSTLKGDIREPSIEWRHFVGLRETLLAIRFDQKGVFRQDLPIGNRSVERNDAIRAEWGLDDPQFDLDGDGRHSAIPQTPFHKIGDFLPARPGLEKLEFESGFLKPTAPWTPAVPYFGRLLCREDGMWRQQWQTKAIPYLFLSNPIVADFDNDGRLEVAVVPHDNLLVFDVASGEEKYRARFTPDGASSGRSYGYLGAHDVDGDARLEFVMVSTFESHIDVLGWKDGKLQALWHRIIEPGINRKKTLVHVPAGPVRDLNGDSQLDIVVSIFNAQGDGRWHVEVLDARTGRTQVDLPTRYLSGLVDLDRSGTAELLCCRVDGQRIPDTTELSVLSIRGGEAVTRWQVDGQSFVRQRNGHRPLHENVSMPDACGMAVLSGAAIADGLPVFMTQRAGDRSRRINRVMAWQVNGDSVTRVGQFQGPGLEVLAVREASRSRNGGLLVRTRYEDGAAEALSGEDANVRPLLSRRIGGNLGPAVAGRLRPDSSVSVIVACPGFRVRAVDVTGDENRVTMTRWTVTGRGSFPADIRDRGLTRAGRPVPDSGGMTLANLTGSGALSTVIADVGISGTLRIRTVNPDGMETWNRDFPEMHGGQQSFVFLHAGHLTDARREDVLVTIQPGHLHSEITILLDGRTGREIWRRSEGGLAGGTRRACGGNRFALDDWDGDGLDDIVCLFPDVIYVMQGSTGKILHDKWTHHVFGQQSLYAAPLVADFLSNGRRQILFAGCTSRLALLDRESAPIWQVAAPAHANGILPSIPPGVGDSDGDGDLELFSLAQRVHPQSREQKLVCYQAADGTPRRHLPLPGSAYGPNGQRSPGCPSVPCTGDVDDDGREECLFTVDRTLYAVGSNHEGTIGRIEWSVQLPDRLSAPIITTTDHTGRARIVVVCADGYVYCVGPDIEAAR